MDGPGSLNSDALPVDPVFPDPAVDPAAVVSDLKPLCLDRLDEVQILKSVYLAEHNITNLQTFAFAWNDRAKLT